MATETLALLEVEQPNFVMQQGNSQGDRNSKLTIHTC